jgi:hypothetical protein
MVNRIFNKPWYQVDPFDRISNKRYSKRHPIKMIISKSFITYKNLEDEKIFWKY